MRHVPLVAALVDGQGRIVSRHKSEKAARAALRMAVASFSRGGQRCELHVELIDNGERSAA